MIQTYGVKQNNMDTTQTQPITAPPTGKSYLQDNINYAKANPSSDFAKTLWSHIQDGSLDEQAQKDGIDLSWAGRPALKPTPETPTPTPSYSEKVATRLGETFQKGGQDVTKDITNIPQKAQEAGGSPLAYGAAALAGAGHVAGDIAGTAGGILGSFLSPLIPDNVKNAVGDVTNTIADKVNSIPGMTPEIAKSLGDVFNTLTLKGGAKAETAVTPAVEKGVQAVKETVPQVIKPGVGKIKQSVQNISEARTNANLQKLVDATSGVSDKGARIATLEKAGMPGGATKGTFGSIETTADARAVARAKSVEGIIKPGANPVDNLTNLNKEIARISEKEVAPALDRAGATVPISEEAPGWSKIVQKLSDIEKPDIIKADSTLDKTYDLVRNRMIEQIQRQPATVKGLWDARKSFDQVVKNQFGDVAFNSEKNTAIKRAISDMRRGVNDMIGERVPEYKPLMDKLSNMYDARYNIAEQYQNLLDKGGVKAWKTLNPKKAAALKWGAILGGAAGTKELLLP